MFVASLQMLWCCFHLSRLLLIVEPCHMATIEVSALRIKSNEIIQYRRLFILALFRFVLIRLYRIQTIRLMRMKINGWRLSDGKLQARKTIIIVCELLRNCRDSSIEPVVSKMNTFTRSLLGFCMKTLQISNGSMYEWEMERALSKSFRFL